MPSCSQYRNLLLVIVLALILRLIGIASRPVWYDEAFSLLISREGPSAVLSGTVGGSTEAAAEEHPPGYYFLLWGWMRAFGDSPSASRALSILASLITVILIYLITQHFFDDLTASIASLFAAMLPFEVHYAQEIRMYVFLALWLSLATYAFIKRKWILFAVAAALAQYTHNLAAFYLLPLAFTPLFQRDWKTLRAFMLAGSASIILYSPWLIHLPAQFSKVNAAYWVERPGIEKLFTLCLVFLPNLPLPPILLWPGLLVSTFVIILAAFQTVRAWRQKMPGAQHGLWFAYLAFAPPLLLWSVSQVVPVYIERALLPSHVMFCIWLAWALTRSELPPPIQRTMFGFILLASMVGIYQHVDYKGFPYGPFQALDQSLDTRVEAGDVIVHSNKLSYLPAFFFDRALPQVFIADPPGGSTDTLAPATIQVLSLNVAGDVESATDGASRVWFVIYERSIEELKGQGYETHPHLGALSENFELTMTEEWDDLRLYLFTREGP